MPPGGFEQPVIGAPMVPPANPPAGGEIDDF